MLRRKAENAKTLRQNRLTCVDDMEDNAHTARTHSEGKGAIPHTFGGEAPGAGVKDPEPQCRVRVSRHQPVLQVLPVYLRTVAVYRMGLHMVSKQKNRGSGTPHVYTLLRLTNPKCA